MKSQWLHLCEENEGKLSFITAYSERGSGNREERERLRGILQKAMEGSLTEMQRFCLMSYYDGLPQKQIAEALGVSRSTVCRHIKSAESKLRKIAEYYC